MHKTKTTTQTATSQEQPVDTQKVYEALVKWKSKELTVVDPQSLDEFCKLHKITVAQAVEMSQSPSFGDDVISQSIQWGKTRIPEMLKIMYNQAKISQSTVEAQKFIDAVTTISQPKNNLAPTTNTQINIFANMDDERYAKIIEREVSALTAKTTANE